MARGQHSDVFLVKFSSDTGHVAWLKRLGQRDSDEAATALVTDDLNHEVIVVRCYYYGGVA